MSFDWRTFALTFRGANWLWIAASVPFILATYLGRALRWQVIIRPARANSSLWNLFSATAIGFTAIVFFGRAGEMVRPYLIASKEKLSFSSQIAAWLLERILDLMMVLLIFGLALAQISRSGMKTGPHLKLILQTGGAIIGVTGALCCLLLLVFRYMTEGTQKRLVEAIAFLPDGMRHRIEILLAAFIDGIRSTRSNSYVLQLLFYSVFEWFLIVLCYFCLLRGFPATAEFSLTDIVIFMGFVSFGSAVQIPGVGGGMQVAASFVFTELFGLPFEVAAGLSLVLWAVTFVVITPIGILLALHDGIKWKNLSHISDEGAL